MLRINPEKGRGVEEASSATIETKLSKGEASMSEPIDQKRIEELFDRLDLQNPEKRNYVPLQKDYLAPGQSPDEPFMIRLSNKTYPYGHPEKADA